MSLLWKTEILTFVVFLFYLKSFAVRVVICILSKKKKITQPAEDRYVNNLARSTMINRSKLILIFKLRTTVFDLFYTSDYRAFCILIIHVIIDIVTWLILWVTNFLMWVLNLTIGVVENRFNPAVYVCIWAESGMLIGE